VKVLQIIESAYRGTLEEQDDTIVWLTHCLRAAGAEVSVLLKNNAVNYVIQGEDTSGLSFGNWKQTNPPQIAVQIEALIKKQVQVHVVREDLDRRGLNEAPRVEGVHLISRAEVAELAEAHDRVLHW
jgi:sulfur transfer complex TusBCD TusB component (DsrH family)